MSFQDLIRKLFPQEPTPDLTPIIQEGERERLRADLVLEQMKRDEERRKRIKTRPVSWEELFQEAQR